MKFETGNKSGKGRPKGSCNKRTGDFTTVLERNNFCAASAMIEIFNEAKKIYHGYAETFSVTQSNPVANFKISPDDNAHIYLKIAGDMAKELASYSYPKRKATETTVDPLILEKIKEYENKSDEELIAIFNSSILVK